MKQKSIQGVEIVEVDTVWAKLPKSFYDLKPVLYKDRGLFCCLFGPDPEHGVLGSGNSPEEAILDWDVLLNELVNDPKLDSEIIQSVRACIRRSKYEVEKTYKGEF